MKTLKIAVAVAVGMSVSVNALAQSDKNNTIDGLTIKSLNGEQSVIDGKITVENESTVNLNSVTMNGGTIEKSEIKHRLKMENGTIEADNGKIGINTLVVSGDETKVSNLDAELDTEISGKVSATEEGRISIGSIYARASAEIKGMVVKAKNIIKGNVTATGEGSKAEIGSVLVSGEGTVFEGGDDDVISLTNTLEKGSSVKAINGGNAQLGTLRILDGSDVKGLSLTSDNTVTGNGSIVADGEGSTVKVGAMLVSDSKIDGKAKITTTNIIDGAVVKSVDGGKTEIGAIDIENGSSLKGDNTITFNNTINKNVTTTGPEARTSIGSLKMNNSSLEASEIDSTTIIDGVIDNKGTMRIGSIDLNNATVKGLKFTSDIKVTSALTVGESSELNIGAVVAR